jgi:hypothetical protein
VATNPGDAFASLFLSLSLLLLLFSVRRFLDFSEFQKNAQWQAGTGSVCRLLRGAGDGAKRAKVRRGVILGCVRFSVAGKTAAESVAFGNERAVLFHLIMPRAGSRHWIGWQDKA